MGLKSFVTALFPKKEVVVDLRSEAEKFQDETLIELSALKAEREEEERLVKKGALIESLAEELETWDSESNQIKIKASTTRAAMIAKKMRDKKEKANSILNS
jgi:Asp-tRNA(Asn)/Glu-tRNA(Gln) amidotransferase C subunit